MNTLAQLRAEALASFGRTGVASGILELRASADGPALGQSDIDALLAKAVARERVSVVLDLLAYEQGRRDANGAVIKNRNGVRVRNGAMLSMGRSGKGTPFMRDHRQNDSTAKGGTVLASRTVAVVEGHYQVLQTVELTEPAAVERALRGLMSAVSIGIEPLGPVMCTACKAEIFSVCYHFPFDVVELKDGTKHEVEWEFSEAGLYETSEVPIGAVQTAEIKSIRGALSALAANVSGAPIPGSVVFRGDEIPEESHVMDPKLLALLGLSATATAAEVIAAVEAMRSTGTADRAELAIANGKLGAFEADIKELKASERKRNEDEFILGAMSTGRIGKGDEEHWRALFGADSKRAVELMAKREPNTATPVGAPRQSDANPGDGLADVPAPQAVPAQHLSGGGIPGFELYARGERSKVERKDIARQLSAAVKRLETHASPQAIWWAERMGFEGRVRQSSTLAATAIANNMDLDAARTAFRAVFMQQLEMGAVSPLELFYTTVPTNTPLAQINWMGDLPGFEEWITERKLAGVEAFKLNLQSKKWANGLRIKNDDLKFDALGLMPQQIGGLATKARRHRLDRMMTMFVEGFDGTADNPGLAYDAAFYFADTHRGGNANKATAALDATALTAAELKLESMTTYDGNDALDVHGSHLMVGPKLRATAEKLLTQERLANGEDNYHRGKYKLIVENRLRGDADDYWYLGDLTHGIKPMIFQMVEEITTSAIMGQEANNSVPSFLNDELWFGAQANYNMAYFEFRLVVGNKV